MSSWIDLRVVDHMVNKESIYYWLMCHEHFEYIWLTGDTMFKDFNPTLFSKIFLVYPLISKKFKIWVYQFFELFMWKRFFLTSHDFFKTHIMVMKILWKDPLILVDNVTYLQSLYMSPRKAESSIWKMGKRKRPFLFPISTFTSIFDKIRLSWNAFLL